MNKLLKKSASQWLLANKKRKRVMIKTTAGCCPSPSICLLHNIQIIKVKVSVNDVFWTSSIKSTLLSKEEPLLVMIKWHFYINFCKANYFTKTITELRLQFIMSLFQT